MPFIRRMFNGAQRSGVTSVAGNYTALLDDYFILADSTAGNMTVTLPNPADVIGQIFIIKKTVAANLVTIAGAAGNVDGATNEVLFALNDIRTFKSDGTNYRMQDEDVNFSQLLLRYQRNYAPPLMRGTNGILVVSGTAYFVYLGTVKRAFTPKFVEISVFVAGVGAQTAELGLFSTPNPPNKTNQNLSKLVATGTISSLTSTGVKRNTAAFATQIATGINLWAGSRFAMATTQPSVISVGRDFEEGAILTLAGSGVLTGAGPFAGTIPTDAVDVATMMNITLD